MSDSQSKTLERWLPVAIAAAALLGNVLYVGVRVGTQETVQEGHAKSIATLEAVAKEARRDYVTRQEYDSDKRANSEKFSEFRQDLREISAKLDRLLEARAK